MITATSAEPSRPASGFTRYSFIRIILATLAVVIPVVLVMFLARQIPDKALRAVWPQLLAALVAVGGYLLYVKKIERRAPLELAGPRAWSECAAGILIGTALFLATIGILATLGSYRLTGSGVWTSMVKPLAEMILVAVVEELLFRGILLRVLERPLGTWGALALTSLLFALAHVPNDGITALAVVNTAVAGLMLGAAYLATRRLWLVIGLHFAWNFVSDGLFSLPVSGHAAKGFLQGQLSGPQWLSGGAYGVEASIVTFVLTAIVSTLLLRHALRKGHAPLALPSKRSAP